MSTNPRTVALRKPLKIWPVIAIAIVAAGLVAGIMTLNSTGTREFTGAVVHGPTASINANSTSGFREQGAVAPTTPDYLSSSFAGIRESGAFVPRGLNAFANTYAGIREGGVGVTTDTHDSDPRGCTNIACRPLP